MTLHLEASLPSSETFLERGRSNCDHHGPSSGSCQTQALYRLMMAATLRRLPFTRPIRTFSSAQPLNNGVLENTSLLPPLGDNHGQPQQDEQPFGLSKTHPGGHAWRPLTLRLSERYKLNGCPAALLPPTIVLRGLGTFPVQTCKYSGAKVNYPANNLLSAKDHLKGHSYPDPMVGASHSFLQKISELSSLEGETARCEKLKKTRVSRKASSS
ncbi:uncharacterized protein si:ch211-171b20.3 isoform X1 [Syngnathus acus]|uniref:uncharacterized protein si:ch211-171b20.3 isoform X1 n=1 Tax=Syngnathus acus TaxID=161584 RepID=UPI001885E3D3|nr:uncharacterized protein si:ch211-171b20.3 isoform X1 [Syngnathus acus]